MYLEFIQNRYFVFMNMNSSVFLFSNSEVNTVQLREMMIMQLLIYFKGNELAVLISYIFFNLNKKNISFITF